MAADTSILFDTRLDPSGFDRGMENVGESVDKFQNTLNKAAKASELAYGQKTAKNIEQTSQKLARQIEQVNLAKDSVARLRKEYEKLVSGDVAPKSVQNLEKELAKVNAEIAKEIANNEKILSQYQDAAVALSELQKGAKFSYVGDQMVTGTQQAVNAREELSIKLDENAARLDALNQRSGTLEKTLENVKMDPNLSEEAQKLADKIDLIAQKTNRLSDEAGISENKITKMLDEKKPSLWSNSMGKASKSVNRLSKTVKSAHPPLTNFEKILRRIRSLIASAFIFNVASRGLIAMKEYIGRILKVNEDFLNSLNSIKVNLMTAFNPIYQAVLPALVSLMSNLSKATAYAAQFVSMLFGKSYESSKKSAQALHEQADALKDVSSSAKSANKNLQGFDKLNTSQSDKQEEGAKGPGQTTTELFDSVKEPDISPEWIDRISDSIERLKTTTQPATEALKILKTEALVPLGDFVWQNLQDFWDLFLVPLGTWVLGEGIPRLTESMVTLVDYVDWEGLNKSLDGFWVQLSNLGLVVLDNLLLFYQNFLVPMGTWVLSEAFPRFVDAITTQLANVDWEILNGAVERLWAAVLPFAENVGEGLLWFWDNVIVPFVGWAAENLVPAAIDLITAAIEFLGIIIEAAEPALLWIWETFLVPIRDFLWEQTTNFLNLLVEAFKALSAWASENPDVIETIAKIVLTFLAGLWLYNTSKNLVSFVKKLGDAFAIFSGKMGMMVIAALPALAIAALAAAIVLVGGVWDKLEPAGKVVTILGALAAAAVAAAIAIAVFHAAWSVGVAAAVIVGSIAAIGIAFANLKKDTGQSWSVSTPTINSSGPAGKGKPESFIDTLSGGSPLPALANGGLIPPRKPRPVIVGDNTREEEIVSPRSAIREEVINALNEIGITGGGNGGGQAGPFEFILELEGRTVGRILTPILEKEKGRQGKRISAKAVVVT